MHWFNLISQSGLSENYWQSELQVADLEFKHNGRELI